MFGSINKAVVLLLVLFVTISCEEQDPTAPKIKLKGEQYKVAVFSDTIQDKKVIKPNLVYPILLRNSLLEQNLNVDMKIFGHTGKRINENFPLLREISEYDPSIVFVSLGSFDGMKGRELTSLRHSLDRIVSQLKAEQRTVILGGQRVPIKQDKRRRKRGKNTYQKPRHVEFAEIYPQVAKRYGVEFVPYIYNNIANKTDLIDSKNIYLTEAGHAKLATQLEPVFKAQVKKVIAAIQAEKARMGHMGISENTAETK